MTSGSTGQHVLLHHMPRRSFVRAGAVASGVLASGSLVPMLVRAQDGTPAPVADLANYAPVALAAAELETLKAATDRIIPPDELGPGATEAGVFVYIDRALAGRAASTLPVFQAGLAALDAAAAPDAFAAAPAETQDAILTSAAAGELADDPGGFFATLLEYTRQGMFADPIHGGNAGFAGWDLIGYPGVKLVWTDADQAIDAEVAPEHISVEQYGGTPS